MNVLDVADRIDRLCDELEELNKEQQTKIEGLRFNIHRILESQTTKEAVVNDVHTRHCCQEHKRCKYGDEDTCSVCTGQKPAESPCNCEWM